MANPVISVCNVNAGYAKSHVLYNVNFEAQMGRITVIIGPNGSGKSTLLKSIFGLCSVYTGDIIYHTQNITGLSPHVISHKKIAYLPQVNNVFANLTIKENLVMASFTESNSETLSRLPEIFETFPILQKIKGKAEILSGGQRQMLAMAMALIRRPKVILFDEPTASLSPKLADEVLLKIIQIKEEYGITIIMVEQNVRRALHIADEVYLLANGKNIFSGKPDILLQHKELGKLYLGIN